MVEPDVGADIMNERITWGVQMVEALAKKYGLSMTEALLVKGIEVGISMYIQKETRARMPK